MIFFKNVTKIYTSGSSPIRALEDVSLEIKEGEFVSIVGRSGAGKTTMLKLLLAQEKPTAGKVFFRGRDVNSLSSREVSLLRREIGAVFQDLKLLPSKTVYENIAFTLEALGWPEEQIAKDVLEVLEIVELLPRKNNFPAEISGGEKQRLAIARALSTKPKVILADEPTGNLDPYHTRDIINLLLKVHQLGRTILLATHNRDIVDSLGKRVVTLEEGRIIRDEPEGRFII